MEPNRAEVWGLWARSSPPAPTSLGICTRTGGVGVFPLVSKHEDIRRVKLLAAFGSIFLAILDQSLSRYGKVGGTNPVPGS